MNTNNPDYVKHAKAALASKAEMDKWKKIEIIDAVAAVTSLAIAWFASSWIIAIAGIVICGGVGAYASSQKEKAKQDTLDHMNRADGMSESLVGATRSRREAENALAGAISKLDEASSKLRRASTYDEKKKAEAEIVSAQAGIESAKLRLQQATAYEATESQRSQQQTQPDVVKINQPIQEAPSVGFSGEKKLSNDGYKIYLVKKYGIEKNDVLGKFVCSERLFESIDEALVFADSLEEHENIEVSIPDVPEIPELISDMNNLRENQVKDEVVSYTKTTQTLSSPPKDNKKLIGLVICVVALIGLGVFYKTQSSNKSQSINTQVSSDQSSYKVARDKLIKQGWRAVAQTDQCSSSCQKWRNAGWVETESCAPSGAVPCIFVFTNQDGNILKVYTEGEDTPIVVNIENLSLNQVSPSFDCTKARSPSEKLICSDSQLANEDNELFELYKSAKLKTKDPVAFKAMTTAAWKEREANCFDKTCLLNWYSNRKVVYQNIINGS